MALYEYFIVDAFASEPFSGNPTAVVVDGSRLTDAQMQAIARETNLTETVFVLPSTRPNAAVKLRTFAPSRESSFSGHGILAAVTALVRMGRFVLLLEEPDSSLPIETCTGLHRIRCERIRRDENEFLVWLDLPQPTLKKLHHDPTKTAGLLGMDPSIIDVAMPAMQTQDRDVLLFVKSRLGLNDAKPDFASLADFSRCRSIRAWCVATLDTLSDSIHVQSRCFAPAEGVNEDTLTASLQGPLAAYLVVTGSLAMVGETAAVTSIQGDSTGRVGLARVLVRSGNSSGYRTIVGGQCVVSMRGQIFVPS